MYTHNISWTVADLMGLELIRGTKRDNPRHSRGEGDGDEGGRGLMFTMFFKQVA